MNKNYANNSNNGGMVTSSTGLFSMKGEPQGPRTIISSTGIFSMTEEPQATKMYSSTGIFTTDETRMYGKWGRRLLTGAALLGGAALANHALGDPWGVGAKAGEYLSKAGDAVGNYFGKPKGNINPAIANINPALAKARAGLVASTVTVPHAPGSKTAPIGKAWDKAKETASNNAAFNSALLKAHVIERTGSLAQKANMAKELEGLIPQARAVGNQAAADEMYNTMRRLNPVGIGIGFVDPTEIVAGAKAAQEKTIASQLDKEQLAKFVPLTKQLVDSLQSQWDAIVDGSTTVKPLALANNTKQAIDQVKGKLERAKANQWTASAKEYKKFLSTLQLIYNNASEAAKARQEMGK